MRPYIENLTETLIGEHKFHSIFAKLETDPDHQTDFVEVAKHILEFQNVARTSMNPETLGKIMCAFESGDIGKLYPTDEVKFGGDCEDLLRQQVATFLAYAIDGKLRKKLSRGTPIPGGMSFRVGIRPTARD